MFVLMETNIKISKSQFERDYHAMTRAELVEKYGLRYDQDVTKILKLCGIPSKRSLNKRFSFIIEE